MKMRISFVSNSSSSSWVLRFVDELKDIKDLERYLLLPDEVPYFDGPIPSNMIINHIWTKIQEDREGNTRLSDYHQEIRLEQIELGQAILGNEDRWGHGVSHIAFGWVDERVRQFFLNLGVSPEDIEDSAYHEPFNGEFRWVSFDSTTAKKLDIVCREPHVFQNLNYVGFLGW
jgi:hypothetical protein